MRPVAHVGTFETCARILETYLVRMHNSQQSGMFVQLTLDPFAREADEDYRLTIGFLDP